MDNITVNMENLTEEEREQLLKLVEKGNKVKSKVWKPENGERYWTMDNEYWDWRNDKFDNFQYSIGNCFKIADNAKFSLEKRKVEVELKRFAEEHNEKEVDWNFVRYYIHYNCRENEIFIFNNYVNWDKSSEIYFTSKEIAKQAIEAIGEERIKKYYFEI